MALRLLIVLSCWLALPVAASEAQLDQLKEALGFVNSARLDDAESIYQSLVESPSPPTPPAVRAEALVGLAIVADYRRDNVAIKHFVDQALSFIDSTGGLGREKMQALSLLGNYYGNLGDEPASTASYQQALELSRSLPEEQAIDDRLLENLGINAAMRGEYGEAERLLIEALDFLQTRRDQEVDSVRLKSNLGWVYGLREEYDKARTMFADTVRHGRQHQPGSLVLANRLANLGAMEQKLGLFEQASMTLQEALNIQLALAPESIDVARTQYTLGELALAMGDLVQALNRYLESVELSRAAAPEAGELALPLTAAASVLISLDRYGEANVYLAEALELSETRAPFTAHHARSLGLSGILASELGHDDAAISYLLQAIDVLEVQYDLLGGSASTLAQFSQTFERFYLSLARIFYSRGEYERSLEVLERYRERSLLSAGLDASLLDANSEVREAVSKRAQSLLDAANKAPLPAVEREVLMSSLEALRSELPGPHSQELRADKRAAVTTYLASQPSDEAALFFDLQSDYAVVFVLAGGQVSGHRLTTSSSELSRQIIRFRAMIGSADADVQTVREAGAAIYNSVVRPIEKRLNQVNRLVVVPHRQLHLVPFAALFDEVTENYLVERFEVVQAGSLSGVAGRPRRLTTDGLTFRGFAYSGQSGPTGARSVELGPLPGADTEIREASRALDADAALFSGPSATETQVRTVSRADILHFATHAVVDHDSPRDSFIALALDDRSDGQLTAWEIANANGFAAQLVVLSACSTAVGPVYTGEGLLGLQKAFSLAGARGVMASLWPVSDRSTSRLMAVFYRALAAGKSPAAALRQAQLDLLTKQPGWWAQNVRGERSASHPFYWAAFTIDRF